jgi:hypothetical protein
MLHCSDGRPSGKPDVQQQGVSAMKSLSKSAIAALFALVMAVQPTPADAQVRYDFTAFSSLDIGTPPDQYSGAFSLTVPSFVVPTLAGVSFPVSSLSSCSIVALSGTPTACGAQTFQTGFGGNGEVNVAFGLANSTRIFYYFAPGSFAAPGTYDTVLFGASQAGRLVVSVVPELSTWAMMALGLAAAGTVVTQARRRS